MALDKIGTHATTQQNIKVDKVYIERKLTSQYVRNTLEGVKLTSEHYGKLFESSCDVYDKSTKQLIFKFRKSQVEETCIELAKKIFSEIHLKMKQSKTRGCAAGKDVSVEKIQKLFKTKEVVGVQPKTKGFAFVRFKIDFTKLIDASIRQRFTGKKVGQEKIFKKNNKAYKYRWSESSQWVEMGEITCITTATKISNPVSIITSNNII